jgi:hypothetical protein
MIRAVPGAGGTVVELDLPDDAAAFFDREWVAWGRAAAVPAIVTDAGADDAAGQLAGIAEAAVAAAPSGQVEVTGSGLVAEEARRRLAGAGRLVTDGIPAAVIETTGDPAALIAATRRVEALGTVVLAGEPLERVYDIDLYPDVHVRGLRLVARGRSGAGRAEFGELASAGLQTVTPGEPLDASARWFCVTRSRRS